MRIIAALSLMAAIGLWTGSVGYSQTQPPAATQAACQSLVPASQGGPMPIGDVAILRWLGTSNYELAYHGKIVIMDTFYDRPARTASLGFSVDQVSKADVILIGHAYFDHISDVAAVAAQTGARVVGSAISAAEAIELGVPKAQTITVTGNETLRYLRTEGAVGRGACEGIAGSQNHNRRHNGLHLHVSQRLHDRMVRQCR